MSYGVESWTAGPYPPYVAIVLDKPEMGEEWKSWLTLELGLRGFVLDVDGMIRILGEDGRTKKGGLGLFRFVELNETEAVLKETDSKVSALDCPWIGANRIRGAFGWVHFDPWEVRPGFLTALLMQTRGPVIRTEDRIHRELLLRRSFDLSNLMGKFGFDDGDALLSRESPYLEYARDEAKKALASAGLEAGVGTIDTHHNPLRIFGPIHRKRDGKVIGESALLGHTMTIWAYDYRCLDDYSFW